jgi:thiol-disulfide isomerase/thioredoxin
MIRWHTVKTRAFSVGALGLAVLGLVVVAPGAGSVKGTPVPPFPSARPADWIGAPITWPELRGRVVLLDVWSFGCGNCVRTLPWLRDVHARYGPKGLAVIGVHSPEFEHEKRRERVEAEVKRHGLAYPQLLDNDLAYWGALRNEYWPTTYLVDRCGRMRERHVGEVHADEASGRGLEARIDALLAEPPGNCPG